MYLFLSLSVYLFANFSVIRSSWFNFVYDLLPSSAHCIFYSLTLKITVCLLHRMSVCVCVCVCAVQYASYMQQLRVLSDGDVHQLGVHDAIQMLQRMDASPWRRRMYTQYVYATSSVVHYRGFHWRIQKFRRQGGRQCISPSSFVANAHNELYAFYKIR